MTEIDKKQAIKAYMEWAMEQPEFKEEIHKAFLHIMDYGELPEKGNFKPKLAQIKDNIWRNNDICNTEQTDTRN